MASCNNIKVLSEAVKTIRHTPLRDLIVRNDLMIKIFHKYLLPLENSNDLDKCKFLIDSNEININFSENQLMTTLAKALDLKAAVHLSN